MARRRRTILELDELTQQALQPGGDNWETCVKAFMDNMTLRNLSLYTKKHHKENLNALYNLLKSLDLPLAPSKINDNNLKKAIVQMIEVEKLSPTTINHRIRTPVTVNSISLITHI